MSPSLVVFLHSSRYDRLYQAVSIILTASSMGRPCNLNLFYGALASYVMGTWDDVNIAPPSEDTRTPWAGEMQRGFELSNFPSLYEMLGKARGESGGVKVFACSTSCKVLSLDMGDVREKVDEIVGLPTMIKIAGESPSVMYV